MRDQSVSGVWRPLTLFQRTLLILLALSICFSAVVKIYLVHIHREQLRGLHGALVKGDALDRQWVMLLVEHSSISSLDSIEHEARSKLGMVIPPMEQLHFK